MTGFIYAAVGVGWLALLGWTGFRAMEDESKRWAAACALVLIVGVGFIVNASMAEEASGPCLKYETGYMYSAATKTMMPYRYCAQRGEWAK